MAPTVIQPQGRGMGKERQADAARREMEQRRYFRHHRHLFADSMATMVEVGDIGDIRRIVEQDALLKGYYRNVRIVGEGLRDERCVPYGWGDKEYHVVADFDGYTGQCIGWANFRED